MRHRPNSFTRRELLARTGIWLPAMHAGLASRGFGGMIDPEDQPFRIRLERLSLQTAELDAQRDFYGEVLELPSVEQTRTRAVFQAGTTRLEFVESADGQAPFYHFAFNIPENKLLRAMDWMEGRGTIITWHKTGKQIVHFDRWNADAIYFFDPAGNIVEFIAHHTLDNAAPGAFSIADIEAINEIGVVAESVPALVRELDANLGAKPYLSSSPIFTAVGDPRGFFICVKKERIWLPTADRAAQVHPVDVSLRSETRTATIDCLAAPGTRIHFEA